MASYDFTSDEDVIWHLEANEAAPAGYSVVFEYGGPGPAADVTIDDTGAVTAHEDWWRRSGGVVVRNTSGTEIARFYSGLDPVIWTGYAAAANRMYWEGVSSAHIIIRSADAIEFVLDYDGDSASTFTVEDHNHGVRFRLHEDGSTDFSDANGSLHADLLLDSASDTRLRLGDGTAVRGVLSLRSDSNRPAVLRFSREADGSGDGDYVWVDSTGDVRINRTDPGTNDTAGTVVGTQS